VTFGQLLKSSIESSSILVVLSASVNISFMGTRRDPPFLVQAVSTVIRRFRKSMSFQASENSSDERKPICLALITKGLRSGPQRVGFFGRQVTASLSALGLLLGSISFATGSERPKQANGSTMALFVLHSLVLWAILTPQEETEVARERFVPRAGQGS
jgi:hypothetical protein